MIAAGGDGNLWFTNDGNGSIGRITPVGVVTNYPGTAIRNPHAISRRGLATRCGSPASADRSGR